MTPWFGNLSRKIRYRAHARDSASGDSQDSGSLWVRSSGMPSFAAQVRFSFSKP
jgi:hypothetical protein